jgi:hypothetical protein
MRCSVYLCVMLVVAGGVSGDEDADKQFQEHALKEASAYRGKIGAPVERELTFLEKPVQRWTNPLQGRSARGDVFLWTDRGRPAAVLSLYEYTDKAGVVHEHHEFSSLSTEPVELQAAGGLRWSPRGAGVEWKPAADAPAPALAARQRLKQMRDIAGQFACQKTTREGETRDLRLLPQPIYRAAATAGEEQEKMDWLDGALFAMVEHTDPEILLLVEAAEEGKSHVWRFAFARLNSIDLKAQREDREVWTAGVLPWSQALNRRDLPYTAFTVK